MGLGWGTRLFTGRCVWPPHPPLRESPPQGEETLWHWRAATPATSGWARPAPGDRWVKRCRGRYHGSGISLPLRPPPSVSRTGPGRSGCGPGQSPRHAAAAVWGGASWHLDAVGVEERQVETASSAASAVRSRVPACAQRGWRSSSASGAASSGMRTSGAGPCGRGLKLMSRRQSKVERDEGGGIAGGHGELQVGIGQLLMVADAGDRQVSRAGRPAVRL